MKLNGLHFVCLHHMTIRTLQFEDGNFTMPNLRKLAITIDFNGNLGYLCGVMTH